MNEAQPAVAEIAALVGNPARANILMALIEGRALTASELSYVAGVSPQTTSEHLAMLREANLLSMTKQGRHCYFRLGSPQVARMIESIMVVAVDAPQRYRPRWNGGERCAPRAPATTTSPAGSASRSPTRSPGASKSCSARTAGWSRVPVKNSSPISASSSPK